jgi:hypothetical protein
LAAMVATGSGWAEQQQQQQQREEEEEEGCEI